MDISFRNLQFSEKDGAITLFGFPFIEVNISGRNKPYGYGSVGEKLICSSEGARLLYKKHTLTDNSLIIEQENELIKTTTNFIAYNDTNAISVFSTVESLSVEPITVENISSLVMHLNYPIEDTDKVYLYKFKQGHHGECQPVKTSLYDLGLTSVVSMSQQRIGGMNIGSWSTKEELPQAIIEYQDKFLMFQIESNNSWYYEISDYYKQLYLYLGGATETFGTWFKTLEKGQSYTTKTATLTFGKNLEDVICEMTKYRRQISGKCIADENLPTIYNEYMHLSWNCPCEENVKKYAQTVKKTGVEYYVIDCGWHDEVGGYIYPFVGGWRESKLRFPSGLKKTKDYLNGLGMKLGLWIEPEIVGTQCAEMIDYYGEECFLHRHGKKVQVLDRYFLDFRKQKVIDYLNQTIRRMVEDYGAEYIKFDYNQEIGVGVDGVDGFAAEFESCANAYLNWVDGIRNAFPNVVFETCASGGMRMDYQTLQKFSITSTSDQTDYKKYPYIACNILSAVLPEQAAVWSYPVGTFGFDPPFSPTYEWVEKYISKECVIMNMINSFLGRMHLASHLELLSEEKLALVKEGVDYYNMLSNFKKTAIPVFPLGFKRINDKVVCGGLKSKDKLVLAVWNLGEKSNVKIPVNDYSSANCVYPKNNNVEFYIKDNNLIINFDECQARFFELEK